MDTFRWVFLNVYIIVFNFVNMRLESEVYLALLKFHKKIYFHGKFVAEF